MTQTCNHCGGGLEPTTNVKESKCATCGRVFDVDTSVLVRLPAPEPEEPPKAKKGGKSA